MLLKEYHQHLDHSGNDIYCYLSCKSNGMASFFHEKNGVPNRIIHQVLRIFHSLLTQENYMSAIVKEIDERRARRAFSNREIPDNVQQRLIEAASYAPSCFNSQPWRFMSITAEEPRKKIRASLTGGNYWAKKATLFIVVATKLSFDAQLSDNREYALFGCGLATQNLLLQATREGLYAHPMAGFDPLMIKEAFNIPEDYTVITIIAVAYPGPPDDLSEKHQDAEKSKRKRKPVEDILCHNSWRFE